MNYFLGNNCSPSHPPSTSASKNIKMLGIIVQPDFESFYICIKLLWLFIGFLQVVLSTVTVIPLDDCGDMT